MRSGGVVGAKLTRNAVKKVPRVWGISLRVDVIPRRRGDCAYAESIPQRHFSRIGGTVGQMGAFLPDSEPSFRFRKHCTFGCSAITDPKPFAKRAFAISLKHTTGPTRSLLFP